MVSAIHPGILAIGDSSWVSASFDTRATGLGAVKGDDTGRLAVSAPQSGSEEGFDQFCGELQDDGQGDWFR